MRSYYCINEVKMNEFNVSRAREGFLLAWVAAFQALLGWSKEMTLAWAKQWEDGLSGKEVWFYHDSPMLYVCYAILPNDFWLRHKDADRVHLEERLVRALEGEVKPGPDGYVQNYDNIKWQITRRKIESILAEYGEELPHAVV
jgi:hypothetical protein